MFPRLLSRQPRSLLKKILARSGRVFFFVLISLNLKADPITLATRSWRMEQGLPENTVTCVRKTQDGYVWVGTRQGLARFDGARIVTFTMSDTPELRSDHITALVEDARGALWIATHGGGVARLREGNFTSFTVRQGLSSDVVNCLAADADGAVWIGTVFGLNRWQGDRLTVFSAADGLPNEDVTALACDLRGTLWVGTRRHLFVKEGDRFRPFQKSGPLPVMHLAADEAGDVWLNGSEHGLLLSEAGNTPARQMLPLVGPASALATTPGGGAWAALPDGSLWQGGRDKLHKVRADLAPRAVTALWDTGNGALLAGTREEGLVVLSPRFFEAHTLHHGPASPVTTAITEDREGRLWSGGERGQLGVWRGTTFHTLDLGKNYPARNAVLALCATADGSVWIGTRGDGVYRWHQGHVTAPRLEGRLPAAVVTALHEARDGTLWLGTEAEGVLKYREGIFTRLTTRDGLPRDQATTISEQPDGTLWFGTAGAGLYQWVGGRVRTYTRADGLGADTILAQHVDTEGRLWIGTANGLSLWQKGRFFAFTRAHGLGEDMVAQIVTDRAGHIWLGSRRGVTRCALSELLEVAAGQRKRVIAVGFGLPDGLPGIECLGGRQNAALCDREGRLWLTTTRGLARGTAAPTADPPPPPPVYLERVVVNDHEVLADPLIRPPEPPSAPPVIEVPPGHAAVAFHFAALALRVPEKTRFRYRLGGLEDEWSIPQPGRSVLYPRVPPGRYTFHVTACDEGGVWSAEDATAAVLIIHPFYWQT